MSPQPTNQDILESINDFANNVEERFNGIETDITIIKNDVSTLDSRMDKFESRMETFEFSMDKFDSRMEKFEDRLFNVEARFPKIVTKEYLDEKIYDLRGDLIHLTRKEDTKLLKLIEILERKNIISHIDANQVQTMEPFAQA